MKKIAVITPSKLPIPAIEGGAIETLTTYLLEENEKTGDFEFTILNRYTDEIQIKYSYVEMKNYVPKVTDKMIDFICKARCKFSHYKQPFNSTYLMWVCKILKNKKYDIILVEGMPSYALRIYKETGIKPILHLHTNLLYKGVRNDCEIVNSCEQIICVSNFIRKQVKTIPNANDRNIKVLLNCI